jgi:hypothetical protein
MTFVSERTRDSSMFQSTGGTDMGAPSGPRESTDPRSKRKPSTWHSVTQYSSDSMMYLVTTGWLALNVFPQPE